MFKNFYKEIKLQTKILKNKIKKVEKNYNLTTIK